MQSRARMQSSLGRTVTQYDPNAKDMTGFLTAARVLKVHHKSGTADVQIVNSNDVIASSSENEGRFAARILENFAGFDEKRNKYWGTKTPVAEGALVLLGFMDGIKERPIILGHLHRPNSMENLLPNAYPLNEKEAGFQRREALKQLSIYPSMAYKKVDGESNIEFSHTSKSFFALYNTDMDVDGYLNDNHGGFDHEHLTEIDSTTGLPYESDFEEAKAPPKILYVHRTSHEDDETTWTKFFLDEFGKFRLTRDRNDNTLTFFEANEDGSIGMKRQLDSPVHDDSSDSTSVMIENHGEGYIERNMDGAVSRVGVKHDGNAEMSYKGGVRDSYINVGDDITIETEGIIISNSLSDFINRNHVYVGTQEPRNPRPGLLWVKLDD